MLWILIKDDLVLSDQSATLVQRIGSPFRKGQPDVQADDKLVRRRRRPTDQDA
jgi:hypothetical protein